MPVTVRLVVGSLLVLAGLALVVVAVLGARSVLRRNRWVGVRTSATLASETQFVAGNRAAAVPVGAAGAVAAVGGAFLLLDGNWVIPTISLLGTLGFTVIGGLVGNRAAAAHARAGSVRRGLRGRLREHATWSRAAGGTAQFCRTSAG